MTQTMHACPQCGVTIVVPANYIHATISCGACGMVIDRHTGARRVLAVTGQGLAQPPAPQPLPTQPVPDAQAYLYPGAQSAPPHPYPGPMPAQGYPYPHTYPAQAAPNRRSKTWVVVLVVVGVFGALFLAGAITAFSKMGSVAKDDWVEYATASGRFRCKFPVKPRESSHPMDTPLGRRAVNEVICINGGITFEASYFDLGDGPAEEYMYDFAHAGMALADGGKGSVQNQQAKTVAGVAGEVVDISMKSGFLMRYFMTRVGNRVYCIGCHSFKSPDADKVSYFIDNWSLLAGGGGQPARETGTTTDAVAEPAELKVAYDAHDFQFMKERAHSATASVEGGAGACHLTYDAKFLPQGLSIETRGEHFLISGAAEPSASTGRVSLTATDAQGTSTTQVIPVIIWPAQSEVGLDLSGLTARATIHGAFSGRVALRAPSAIAPQDFDCWAIEGSLPPGISCTGDGYFLNVAGTPARAGTWEVLIVWRWKAPGTSFEYRVASGHTFTVAKAE